MEEQKISFMQGKLLKDEISFEKEIEMLQFCFSTDIHIYFGIIEEKIFFDNCFNKLVPHEALTFFVFEFSNFLTTI